MSQISGRLVPRTYSGFRGVDFSERKDEVNFSRSPDALNMWKNYRNETGKCIETRPGVELLAEYSNTIFGLFFYTINGVNHRIVHSGTKLYDGENVIYENMAEHKSHFFVFKNILYIKDGTNYLNYDGNTCSEVVGFVPTTTISRSPSGGGVTLEDVNFLSPYRINSFCADGTSREYHLDSQNLDVENVTVWKLDENGQKVEMTGGFSTDYAKGYVTFDIAPEVPLTDGEDNVFIRFKKTVDGYPDRIKKCTLFELFDNRVFFSGNPDYPNVVYYCELYTPNYFGDQNYILEGDEDARVKSLITGNNALWVLKEPSQSNTTIFYHNPTIGTRTDGTQEKIYPSYHSSISTGCKTIGINFNDTICFYSNNGLEAITGDVTTEQAISHKSSLVDARLLNENLENMNLAEWEGYLLTIIGNKIFLADSRQYSQVNDHYEYEWFYFELDQEVTNTLVKDGVLYLCTKENKKVNGIQTTLYRIYKLSDYSKNRKIESYWTTIADEFNYPQYQKITNKKGCVLDVEGEDIEIYAQADNKGFDFIKRFKQVPKGYVVARIKKKKWKSIQLKFKSDKPFQLYSSTLESYIGSYIKR